MNNKTDKQIMREVRRLRQPDVMAVVDQIEEAISLGYTVREAARLRAHTSTSSALETGTARTAGRQVKPCPNLALASLIASR